MKLCGASFLFKFYLYINYASSIASSWPRPHHLHSSVQNNRQKRKKVAKNSDAFHDIKKKICLDIAQTFNKQLLVTAIVVIIVTNGL